MRKGLNAALIACMIILLAGCSASRRRKSADVSVLPADASIDAVISNVVNYNITGKGFVIKRGRIELEGTEFDGSFGFTARLNSKGDMVAAVKGPLGIELVRLIAVGNDIAAIDRISRIVYVGKKDAVMKKNGLPDNFIEVIFGDLPDGDFRNYRMTEQGELILALSDKDFENEITVCPDESKVCREQISSQGTGHEITLDFSYFRSSGDVKYASEIVMKEKKKMLLVKLTIDDFISIYDEKIEFSLPSYKRGSL